MQIFSVVYCNLLAVDYRQSQIRLKWINLYRRTLLGRLTSTLAPLMLAPGSPGLDNVSDLGVL